MAKQRHIKSNSLVGPLFLEGKDAGPHVVVFRGDGVIITDDTTGSVALTPEHFKSLIAAAPTIAAALAI